MSIHGGPRERGFAHGFFISKEFAHIQKTLTFIIFENYGKPWEFFIDAGRRLYRAKLQRHFKEFYDEMEGIADGINEGGGTTTTLDEIIAWNNYFALTENWYSNQGNKKNEGGTHLSVGGRSGQKDRCSAFIATGDFTKDGKIVCAHNNFSDFVDGQFANCVIDLKPDRGHRILYQAFAGFIWSGTDFFVTSKGIIGTETTIGGFLPFENRWPISCRIRQAMQYGNSLDDYVRILKHGNSGDYANSWLFGDINTNEILRLELGLKYQGVERTSNGYFIGFNAATDPRIRNLECTDSGYDDVRRHQGARRVRLDDLVQANKGTIDVAVAKKIISDHYDVYLNKENPCSRTCCSHYDLDAREYMSDPSRPKPFSPHGAVDGCVVDAAMAKAMSFELRYGNSCGTPFDKEAFCDKHKQWANLRPFLRDRPTQPWTPFSTTENEASGNKRSEKGSNKRTNKRSEKRSEAVESRRRRPPSGRRRETNEKGTRSKKNIALS
jgi:hypothetical protein